MNRRQFVSGFAGNETGWTCEWESGRALKAVGGFGLAFLLPAVLGHNSDLDIVG